MQYNSSTTTYTKFLPIHVGDPTYETVDITAPNLTYFLTL